MKFSKDEFIRILNEYPDAVSDHRKLSGLLRDLFPQETRRIRLLLNLHELGIHDDIAGTDRISNQFIYRYKKRLVDDYGVSDKNAFWGVYVWCICYGMRILGKACELPRPFEDLIAGAAPPVKQAVETPERRAAADFTRNILSSIAAPISSNHEDFFVNVSFEKLKDRIFIPCGLGASDNGYYICGLTESKACSHKYANIYALVYNYILRNSRMVDSDMPHCLKNIRTPFQIDYQKIFRLETIILQLIKNNYISDSAAGVRYDGDPDELKCALKVINDYAALFCRLVGITPCPPLKITFSYAPVNITLTGKKGVYIQSSAKPCKAREIWYGQKINYRLSESSLGDLEYLLGEISPIGSFNDGQFDLLKSMLGADGHSICIMPAGTDKSLIFYMVSLLQPIPVFIVAPTDILIRDQIRNLRITHRIDNASHITSLSDDDFTNFEIRNNLIFLTPTTFQNRNLLERFRQLDEDMQVSYVILDEVHCLSNRDRGFIPEYLTLSKFLRKLIDRAAFICFTATPNYAVIEDVRKQLSIPGENIFLL